jgi:hypothetical protein
VSSNRPWRSAVISWVLSIVTPRSRRWQNSRVAATLARSGKGARIASTPVFPVRRVSPRSPRRTGGRRSGLPDPLRAIGVLVVGGRCELGVLDARVRAEGLRKNSGVLASPGGL